MRPAGEQGELLERKLAEAQQKCSRPIVLFIPCLQWNEIKMNCTQYNCYCYCYCYCYCLLLRTSPEQRT